MLDAGKLLEQFLGTRDTRHRSGYQGEHGSYGRPGHSKSGIEQAIGSVLGGSGSRPGSGALPGAIAGGLASYLLKGKRRKGYGGGFGGSVARTGGTALLAGLAYKAFQQYQASQAQQPAAPPPATATPAAAGPWSVPRAGAARAPVNEAAFHPAPNEEDARARLLLSAMIAAAKADGYIDQNEQEAIFGRIDELDLDADEKGFMLDEMRKPRLIDELVRGAKTPEVAAEVYLASLLAIDPDHPAEIAYLDMLAARLNLPPALASEIRRTDESA